MISSHFQLPPMNQVKVVYCLQGAVLDLLPDLRVDSPTYEQSAVIELSSEKENFIYFSRACGTDFVLYATEA
jgi:dTDP-4-dehydrorhamnose 3,5-epimerase